MEVKYQCRSCIAKHYLPSSKLSIRYMKEYTNQSASGVIVIVDITQMKSIDQSFNSISSSDSYDNELID